MLLTKNLNFLKKNIELQLKSQISQLIPDLHIKK